MIACFLKDFRLMRNQIKFFAMVVLISILLMVGNNNPFFVVSYTMFVCSFSIINTIAYDEAENGYTFLFTLPISRKQYVAEKYMFSLGLMGASALIGLCILTGYLIRQNELADIGNYFFMTCNVLVVVIGYIAILLPVIFKCGIEKGRLVLSAAISAIGGGILFYVKLLPQYMHRAGNLMEIIGRIGKMRLLGLGVAVCVLAVAISLKISVCIVEKKEF